MSETGSRMTARKAADEGDFWPEDRPGLPRRKLLFGVAAVVVVVVVAVAAFMVLSGGDDKKTAAGSSGAVVPTVYTPAMPNKDTAKLAQRSVDPRPLTEGEVFTPSTKTVTYRQHSFTLAGADIAGDCAAVTWGARLQADLKRHGCNQIVRGAYVSRDKVHVGQFIAVNLSSQEGADQIIRDLDKETNAGFVLPLKAPGVDAFGKGFSAAYSQSYGHYAIVTWVQRAGGVQPASLNEMIDVSLAVEKPGDFVWGRLELVPNAKRPG